MYIHTTLTLIISRHTGLTEIDLGALEVINAPIYAMENPRLQSIHFRSLSAAPAVYIDSDLKGVLKFHTNYLADEYGNELEIDNSDRAFCLQAACDPTFSTCLGVLLRGNIIYATICAFTAHPR